MHHKHRCLQERSRMPAWHKAVIANERRGFEGQKAVWLVDSEDCADGDQDPSANCLI